MLDSLVWVIGKGGLLGQHLNAMVSKEPYRADVWEAPFHFAWEDPQKVRDQLQAALLTFLPLAHQHYRSFSIFWAAGRGIIGSTEESMSRESQTLENFLSAFGDIRMANRSIPGLFFLASSAGGVYGDNDSLPFNEASACQPVSPYGHHKLRQEGMVRTFANQHPGIAVLIGRISSLYGPGQNQNKAQGLISQISRRILHRFPISILVPLDTLRDYLHVEDCSHSILHCASRILHMPTSQRSQAVSLKIFASEELCTIARVLGIFSHISAEKPKFLCSEKASSGLQVRKMQFRSCVDFGGTAPKARPLLEGIASLHRHHFQLMQAGKLAHPTPLVL
ncbi:MAG: NAD-dependent epimerase/dehydratase family protein [Deltaproteobacteria bacterium]|nr:NAD-dependent epimerase/dehydratase family protein [Deltaproteobacteria bacterium]MBI3294651.1 NAD-dependent epimerase/dehydratase family protein [Deltaproteobacteria bacterium]